MTDAEFARRVLLLLGDLEFAGSEPEYDDTYDGDVEYAGTNRCCPSCGASPLGGVHDCELTRMLREARRRTRRG